MCWWRFHLQSQHHSVGSLIRHPRCVANKTPRLPLNTFFCAKTYSVVDAVFCRGWFECPKCVQTCFVYIMVVVVFCSERIQRRWRVRLPTPRCEHLWRGLSLCVACVKEPLWIISGPDSPEVIQSSWVKGREAVWKLKTVLGPLVQREGCAWGWPWSAAFPAHPWTPCTSSWGLPAPWPSPCAPSGVKTQVRGHLHTHGTRIWKVEP